LHASKTASSAVHARPTQVNSFMTSRAAGLAAAVTAAATGLYLLYQSDFARRQQDEVHAAFAEYSDSPLHLIATDMDGTLLSPAAATEGHANGYLSERTISTARSLAMAGVIVCIATGRPAPALVDHVMALGISLPCICFNGAAVLRMHADGRPPESLWACPLATDAVAAVLAFADAEGLCCSYSLLDRAVAACATPAQRALLDEYMRLEGVAQQVVSTTAELASLPEPPLKMVLLTPTPDASAARASRALGGLVHVVSAEMHVEFLMPGVNKGGALAWLCAREGLSCAHAVAFGDNHNDVEMLRAAGLGCAMSNAKPEVKQAADVTLRWSNAEDGVARQCEKLRAEGRLRPRR